MSLRYWKARHRDWQSLTPKQRESIMQRATSGHLDDRIRKEQQRERVKGKV